MNIPKHVAIILDGNRRYAKKKGLPGWSGHLIGSKKVDKLLDWCKELKIREITLYTFSMENFKRSKMEINHLMNLFRKRFEKENKDKKIMKEGVRIRFIGRKYMFPKDLQKSMAELEKKTKNNKNYLFNFAMGYSGRTELVDAVKKIAEKVKKKTLKTKNINEEIIRKHLYLQDYPDLIIRTAGEKRISNFLIFQAAYSELVFVNKFWPEFSKKDFINCIKEFSQRERRFGK